MVAPHIDRIEIIEIALAEGCHEWTYGINDKLFDLGGKAENFCRPEDDGALQVVVGPLE